MTAYLLWGGIAAMVPATLVVISIAYGLRALRRARADADSKLSHGRRQQTRVILEFKDGRAPRRCID